MPDNINLIVNETIDNVIINPSTTNDIVDVNIYETVSEVDVSITEVVENISITVDETITSVNIVVDETIDLTTINVTDTPTNVAITVNPINTVVNLNKVTSIGGTGNTNLSYTSSPFNGYVNSDTGTSALIQLANSTTAGLLAPAQQIKLSNLSGVNTGDQDISLQSVLNSGQNAVNKSISLVQDTSSNNPIELELSSNPSWGENTTGVLVFPALASQNSFYSNTYNNVGFFRVSSVADVYANKFIKNGGTGLNVLLDNGLTQALSSITATTNLTTTQTASNFTINSDTGTDAVVLLGNGTLAGASLNNYTTAEQTKLAGIATGAEVNVNADWNATSGDAQILNKPTIPSIAGLATTTYVDNADAEKENYLSIPAANGYVLSSTTSGIRSWVEQTGGGGGGGDMFKSTYDVNNSGVVDNAETISIIGRNSTGSTLYKGTIIYINGSTGNRPNFVKAQANSEAPSAGTFGVIQNDIANNADGYVTALGHLDNLDTRAGATNPFTSDTLVDGDIIYLSPTTAGYITNVKPSAPNHLVYLGNVVRTHPTLGTIVYRIENGFELHELANVAINGVSNNQLLSYDSATSLWKNKSVTTADITASTNKNYVTDTQLTIIGNTTASFTTAEQTKLANTSGTNTGDNATNTQYSGLASSKQNTLSGTGFVKSTAGTISYDNNNFTIANPVITGATNTKITYDSKGLVIGSTTLIASDIPTIAQSKVTNLTTDLASKAPLDSPAFTGNPTAITQSLADSTTKLSTTEFVQTLINNKVGNIITIYFGTSFTTPSNTTTSTVYFIEMVGGGGGGGGGVGTGGSGSGGGGGGYLLHRITGLTPSTTYTCAIGQGGAGGASAGAGVAGGNTTLTINGDTFTANGGGGGLGAINSAGGTGGVSTGGFIGIFGQNGADSLAAGVTVPSPIGGSSPKGWGYGGLSVFNAKAGKVGTGFGGGGSAGKNAGQIGGAGSNGIIHIIYNN